MKALFVSDIHIGEPADARAQKFLRFLDACVEEPPAHLFLVGDIFDLWIADHRYFIDRYHEIIARVRRLITLGCEVHYFEGNHDLDLDRFWRRKLGVTVHEGPTTFEVGSRAVRVEHGDQMDPFDHGYKFLRWLLRTPVVRALGRYLPGLVVRWIGERASRASRHYTSEIKTSDPARAKRLMREHVTRLKQHATFDVFVAGHVHVTEDDLVEGVRVIGLGTWLIQPQVLLITEHTVELISLE